MTRDCHELQFSKLIIILFIVIFVIQFTAVSMVSNLSIHVYLVICNFYVIQCYCTMISKIKKLKDRITICKKVDRICKLKAYMHGVSRKVALNQSC